MLILPNENRIILLNPVGILYFSETSAGGEKILVSEACNSPELLLIHTFNSSE